MDSVFANACAAELVPFSFPACPACVLGLLSWTASGLFLFGCARERVTAMKEQEDPQRPNCSVRKVTTGSRALPSSGGTPRMWEYGPNPARLR